MNMYFFEMSFLKNTPLREFIKVSKIFKTKNTYIFRYFR